MATWSEPLGTRDDFPEWLRDILDALKGRGK